MQGYTDNYEDATHKYLDALKTGSGATKEEQERLRINYLQFRSDVGTLQVALKNSIAEDDKQKADKQLQLDQENEDKRQKQAEENHKKALAEMRRRAEESKRLQEQLQKEWDALTKSIESQTDKLFLSSLELTVKNIEDQSAVQLAELKKLFDAKIINQEQYNDASLQLEQIRVRSLINANLPTTQAITATPAKGATIGSLGGPSAGAVASAQSNGPATAKIFDVAQVESDAKQVLDTAQTAFDIVSSFNAAADARDQAKIDKKIKDGEAEKQRNKRLLDSKVIDQQEYERRIRAIDEKTQKDTAKLKKAQFDRDKKAQIVSATIMGAQAVLSALTLQPFYVGLIMAAIATAKSLVEINKIKNTKAPEFARGGILDGPSHAHGGMPVINPNTGRKVAEMEGGEAILSRRTYANNRSIIDTLLFSSMYRNGAAISPAWQGSPYFAMDYGALNRSVNHVRRYDRGGIFGPDGNGTTGGQDNAAIVDVLSAVNRTLQTPQKNYIVLSEINAGNEVLNNIKSDTVMSRK